MKQGSAEWMHARAGCVTASRIADVMARTKNGPSEKRNAYMRELLAERLTGQTAEHFVNDAMVWGIENEALARGVYEAKTGAMVEEVGFILHPTIPRCGASPDGLVGEDGLIEIKCPNTGTHIETLLSGEIDPKYRYQMAWQLECTGRKWCAFVSYDPRIPGAPCYFQTRFIPEPEYLEGIRAEVIKFLAELDELEARVRAYHS